LCTGANYCAPWRSDESNLESYDDREKEIGEVNQKFKDSKSILCIGAGSTGIEMAGYLKDSFPEKKIGIC
jgi:NADH dehydrogenase FAD-containing subunit